MKPFELLEPGSLDEAIALLDRADPSVRPASGCTALMLMMKAGVLTPTRLVSLRRIEPRYGHIELGEDELRIGATCTLASMERSGIIQRAKQRRQIHVRIGMREIAAQHGNVAHANIRRRTQRAAQYRQRALDDA